jgi:hypothetical protein
MIDRDDSREARVLPKCSSRPSNGPAQSDVGMLPAGFATPEERSPAQVNSSRADRRWESWRWPETWC